MEHFDLYKDTYVTVDASTVGLSAILTQCASGSSDHKVIAYASRSLSAVESCYYQTEKEALGIVWAVDHFHIFLYGKEFTLITDHRPLEIIYGNSSSKTSARIERWVLRLQPYTYIAKYKPGSESTADYFHSMLLMPRVVSKKSTLRNIFLSLLILQSQRPRLLRRLFQLQTMVARCSV